MSKVESEMNREQNRDLLTRVEAKAPSVDMHAEECIKVGRLDPCTSRSEKGAK